MTKGQIENFMSYCCQMFGRSWPADSQLFIIGELENEPIEAAHKAVSQMKADGTKYLPAPVEIVKLVREWGAELREQQSEREKRKENSEPKVWQRKQNTEHARDSIKLIKVILSGKIERTKIIEGCYAMENSYPGNGWEDCRKNLEDFF